MTLRSSCLVFALISTLMLVATGAMAVPFTLTLDLAVEDTTLTDPSGHAGPYGLSLIHI